MEYMGLPINELVPLSSAARRLEVSIATMTRAARNGNLKALKLANGMWLTTNQEAERWKSEDYRKHVSEKSAD